MTAKLVSFDPRFSEAFASLNYEWIQHYFEVEQEDRDALEDPVGYAIEPGGEIFFVLEERENNGEKDEEPVGTVAMVPKPDGVFELAKMAVRPDRQGKGYSNLLMNACIEFAHSRGAREVMLVTNDILAPAMGLYTKAGFKTVEFSDNRYARDNTEMRLKLTSESCTSLR